MEQCLWSMSDFSTTLFQMPIFVGTDAGDVQESTGPVEENGPTGALTLGQVALQLLLPLIM
jgi:hypothetical protein